MGVAQTEIGQLRMLKWVGESSTGSKIMKGH